MFTYFIFLQTIQQSGLIFFFHYSAGICGFHVWRTLADVNVNNNGVVDIDRVKDAQQTLIN